jgi:pimeloyl-ACP methyl ester carboxylesterase
LRSPVRHGKCSLADARKQIESGLTDAMASTETVVRQVVLPRLKPKDGRLILWGSSRGGILAFQYAAMHPNEVRGIVAVSPGWLSMPDKWPAQENKARLAVQSAILSRAAKTYKGPSLWVYADGDPFYPEIRTRPLFDAFKAGGGQGRYVQIHGHKLPNGHVPPVDLWAADADGFLRSIE